MSTPALSLSAAARPVLIIRHKGFSSAVKVLNVKADVRAND